MKLVFVLWLPLADYIRLKGVKTPKVMACWGNRVQKFEHLYFHIVVMHYCCYQHYELELC